MRALKWLRSWIALSRTHWREITDTIRPRPGYRPQAEMLEDRLVPALFSSPITLPTNGNAPFAVAVDDFNADGRPDIAVTNFNSGTLSVGLGNGAGGFTAAVGSPFAVGASAGAVAAGDFNFDGRVDIAVADPNDSRVVYFFGGTAFVSAVFNLASAPLSAATADFNGDGFADLAVGLQNGDVRVIFGASTIGGFTNSFVASGPGPVTALMTGDFNNDGLADIAAVRETSTGTALSLYFGTGMGTFAPGPFITMSATRATGITAGDFRGTGRLDLAIANFTNARITVVLSSGPGTFETPIAIPVLGNPWSVVAADFNRDGRVDLVKANNANNSISPMIGNGDGTFLETPPFPAGTAPQGMAVGDFNSDGLPDLVVADSSSPGAETTLLNTNRTHLSLSAPASATPGVPFSFTVTALDNSNNIQSSYRGTVQFTSTDRLASLPANYTFTAADAGSHTFSVTLQTAGQQTIVVSDTSDLTIRNFVTVNVINPPPSLNGGSLSVTSAVEGSAGFTLTVNGSNFVPTSVVNWNGAALSTTFISSMQLSAVVPSADLAEEGTANVTVVNPPPGGGTAGPLTFTITDADLTLTGRPVSGTEGIQATFQVASLVDANPSAPASDFTSGGGSITINWGDGSSSSGTVVQPGGVGTAFLVRGVHTYAEEGSYSISVTVTDDGGSTASTTATATIADASLSLSANPIKVMATVAFMGQLATFVDANPTAPLTDFTTGSGGAVIDWGDGTTSAGVVTQPSGTGKPFVVTGTHTYATADFHIFKVTVTDIGGSTASGKALAGDFKVHDIAGRWAQAGQWWVGQSNGSNAFSNALWASWSPNVTWVDVVTGDFNGDGKTDIAGREKETGQWWVAISNGTSFTTTLWTSWSTAVTWVDVKVGDFTGSGRMSIAGRVLETGQWWVAQSTGASFTNSLWTTWSVGVTWVNVNVGDFTGDGKADIAGRALELGQWWVAQSNGTAFSNNFWAAWSTAVTWVDVNVGDFNGDGKTDITGRWLQAGQWWTGLSTGSSFNTTFWGAWAPNVTWVNVMIGDFNGDGSADIIGRVQETGQWWVAFSNGSNAFGNVFFAQWSRSVAWADVQVADFNADGRDDIAGRDPGTGAWWVALSNGTTGATSLWTIWATGATWVDVRSGVFV